MNPKKVLLSGLWVVGLGIWDLRLEASGLVSGLGSKASGLKVEDLELQRPRAWSLGSRLMEPTPSGINGHGFGFGLASQ